MILSISSTTLISNVHAKVLSGSYYDDTVKWTSDSGVLKIEGTGGCYFPVGAGAVTKVLIGDGITFIKEQGFYNKTDLTFVSTPSTLEIINSGAFRYDSNLITVNLSEGLKTINPRAFSDCTSLESLTLPSTVTSIGYETFNACKRLKDINIPSGVTILNEGLFQGCSSLESFKFPVNVTCVEKNVFKDCTNLKTIYYTGTAEQWKAVTINDGNDYLKNANVIYNSDQMDEEAKKKALEDLNKANAVVTLINALPETITDDDVQNVKAAQDAYDALTDDQKKLIEADVRCALTVANYKVKLMEKDNEVQAAKNAKLEAETKLSEAEAAKKAAEDSLAAANTAKANAEAQAQAAATAQKQAEAQVASAQQAQQSAEARATAAEAAQKNAETTTKKVVVGKAKISKVKAGKKQFMVSWKATSKAKTYRVAYKLTTSKVWSYKRTSKRSLTVKKLKAKKYNVKVQGINGAVYGKWSSAKNVKVK